MLFLGGFPINPFSAQDSQQKLWPFQIALLEQSSVEGSKNQQVLSFLDARERHVACHRTRTSTYLHVHDCCLQRLSLRGMGCL